MKEKVITEIKSWIPYVLILVGVILIKMFVVTTIFVHGPSMYPTLHDKDIMIMDELFYKIGGLNRYDIVVVKNKDSKIIKRVIALPGETIKYEGNMMYINGNLTVDEYRNSKIEDFEVTLGSDEYFVMGDNRSVSLDSRSIGPVKSKNILGRAGFTIYPFNRIGLK